MPDLEHDLVAIGGGTAGLVSAAGASYIGAKSALVERARLGGDCLWTGCVPSKALIASARLAHSMRHAERLGLQGAAPGHAFAEVVRRMKSARERVARHDDPDRFRKMGVTVHFGEARFTGPGVLEVEGVGTIRSRRFVVATGAVPTVPPVPGLEEAGYLTHLTAFDQTALPDRILILGGGPIGLEFAQVYARLGARVTVVEMLPSILQAEDPDVSEALRLLLEAEGIGFVLSERAERVEVEGGSKVIVTDRGRRLETDQIFVATGRRPEAGGLEPERAGIELDEGAVRVDDKLRSTARGVWAAGDVTGGLQFTHVADYMAKIVVRNALLPFGTSVDYSTVPSVTYTDPEVASIGMGQQEAEANGASTYRYDLADLDRAIVDAATDGFVKISASGRGEIVGATILAHGAGDLLMPIAIAMKKGLSLSDVGDTIFPYPTMVEGVLRAANEYRRGRLDSFGGRVLKKVVSWLA